MHLCAKHGCAYPLTPSTNRFQRFFNVRTISFCLLFRCQIRR